MRKPRKIESNKTQSRRAAHNLDQRNPLAAVSALESAVNSPSGPKVASRATSRTASRAVSRAASRANSRHRAPFEERDVSDNDDSRENVGGESGDEDRGTASWGDVLETNLAIIGDRKHYPVARRTQAIRAVTSLLRKELLGTDSDIQASSSVEGDQVLDLIGQLVKTVKHSDGRPEGNSNGGTAKRPVVNEQQAALEALAVATLVCPTSMGGGICAESVDAVRHVARDALVSTGCVVAALRALAVVTTCGSGADHKATVVELMAFLLTIIETDGDVIAREDDAAIVTVALQAWSFCATYLMASAPVASGDAASDSDSDVNAALAIQGPPRPRWSRQAGAAHEVAVAEAAKAKVAATTEDEQDEARDAGELFAAQSMALLAAARDQLESTDLDVQLGAGDALCLLYEASRNAQALIGRPLPLRVDPVDVAVEVRGLAGAGEGRSVKKLPRSRRRELQDHVRLVASSLERGVGPDDARRTARRSWPPKSSMAWMANLDADDTTSSAMDRLQLSSNKGKKGKVQQDKIESSEPTSASSPSSADEETDAYGEVDKRQMPAPTWLAYTRSAMFQAVLRSGFRRHVLGNPRIQEALDVQRNRRMRVWFLWALSRERGA